MTPTVLLRFVFIVLFGLLGLQVAPSASPLTAQETAACLAPDDTSLKFLGYSQHVALIPYRYADTGVPESNMKGEPYVSVLFLSNSKRRALLVFGFRLPDGRIEAMYGGYFMREVSGKWKASEGNGGPGMYARVEKFVTNLTQTPEYILDFRKHALSGCISQYEYEQHEKYGK